MPRRRTGPVEVERHKAQIPEDVALADAATVAHAVAGGRVEKWWRLRPRRVDARRVELVLVVVDRILRRAIQSSTRGPLGQVVAVRGGRCAE